MPRYYYEPETQEAEPLEYEFDGEIRAFASPHMYHTKVEEWYPVGVLTNQKGEPRIGVDGKPLVWKSRKWKFIPDEAKNKLLAEGKIRPPQNWLDLSQSEEKHIRTGRWAHVGAAVISDSQVKARQEAELDRMRLEHLAEIERLRKELAEEKSKALRELEQAKKPAKK